MKRNDLFDTPSRQSRWAIAFIVLKFFKKLFSFVWPLGVAMIIGNKISFDGTELVISGLGAFGMIASVAAYFRNYFYISENELVIQSGILKKIRLNIPFERIQSVNFTQSILHRILQVTQIEIETAGSNNKESILEALSQEDAEALRKILLERRDTARRGAGMKEVISDLMEVAEEHSRDVIVNLSNEQLFKIGITQNHLASIGVFLGFFFTMYFQFVRDSEIQRTNIFEKALNYLTDLQYPMMLGLAMVLFLMSMVYSIVGSFFRHYELTFWREGSKFQVVQGLTTKREFAALDSKIQMMMWSQNLLQRLVGYFDVFFKQAKSGDRLKVKMEFKIPGCSQEQVDIVKEKWLGQESNNLEMLQSVSSMYFWRTAVYMGLFYIGLLSALAYIKSFHLMPLAIAIMIVSIGMRWFKYKKIKYAYDSRHLYIRGGVFGYRHVVLPTYKIQNLSIGQSPYQWRKSLGSLRIDTAAGRVEIPYLPIDIALAIMDDLLYEVESTRKEWM